MSKSVARSCLSLKVPLSGDKDIFLFPRTEGISFMRDLFPALGGTKEGLRVFVRSFPKELQFKRISMPL